MICIADSGSTKTDWVIIDPSHPSDAIMKTGIGLNPYHFEVAFAEQELAKDFSDVDALSVEYVYFYGAGCSTIEKCQLVKTLLSKTFSKASIEVNHDLMGAARALCLTEDGIACILGTGANSCLFINDEIVQNVPSLGYVLSDEGAGVHLGKELVRSRVYETMPKDLRDAFDAAFSFDREVFLDRLYHQPLPNRYLASFAVFCSQQRQAPFVQSTLRKVFHEFVNTRVMPYQRPDLPVHFLGSIAMNFQDELMAVLASSGYKAGRFIQKPIDALVALHTTSHAV